MTRKRAAPFVLGALVASAAVGACGADEPGPIPVRPAPPSRHADLALALRDDARGYAFREGDWLEDLGDAPFFGLAWLARIDALDETETERRDAALARARRLVAEANLLAADVEEPIMAALGLAEWVGRTHDAAVRAELEAFVDRLDTLVGTFGDYLDLPPETSFALRVYGPTAVTALVALVLAQYALLAGGPRAAAFEGRAVAIAAKVRERAFGDLVAPGTGRSARAYAFAPGEVVLSDYPNVAMLLLEARLYRLTRSEEIPLRARALHAALQTLKLSDAPARYASPYAMPLLGVTSRDASTLSSQNYLTLALLLLFEITGDGRFIDEADRMLDGIAGLRGPWCRSHSAACDGGACGEERCASGLVHHVVDGRLAAPPDETVFCSGCNLQTLYVLAYRRALAGEPE